VNGHDICDLTAPQLQRIFGVNVLGHFYLVKHVLPSMKQSTSDCMIVSIASMV
jgi:NAD(P)-dependent dehydrogenase (short-subunit alcohol dehydrogenase family)